MIRRKSTNHVHFLFDWVRTMLLAQWGAIITFVAIAFLIETLVGSETLYALLGGVLFAIIIGQVQQNILQNYTEADFKGWTFTSAVGGGLSMIPLTIAFGEFDSLLRIIGPEAILHALPATVPPAMLVVFMLMSMANWFILRQIVDNAWLWIVANVVGALMFLPFMQGGGLISLVVTLTLAMLAQHIVTGTTLFWLFQEDSKPDDGLPDEDRYARAYVEVYSRDEYPYN